MTLDTNVEVSNGLPTHSHSYKGSIIYDTGTSELYFYNGNRWVELWGSDIEVKEELKGEEETLHKYFVI